MPEAPEVSYIADYIDRHCEGKMLTSVEILRGRYKNHGVPKGFESFATELPLRLTKVESKGKVLFLFFEKDWCLISKLGLSGWWYVNNDTPYWTKGTPNLSFLFRDDLRLTYTDLLSYGTLRFTKDPKDVEKEKAGLAPEVTAISVKEILARLTKRKTLQKKLLEDILVDQKALFSGIGNYLKAEILYKAGLSPLRTAGSVREQEWEAFLTAARTIIQKMRRAIGQPDPALYGANMQVYRKTEDPLGRKVVQRRTREGRTTYWVPAAQT